MEAKEMTGIVIMRCQRTEDICPTENWNQRYFDNSEIKKFFREMEEIVLAFIDCGGCIANKEGGKEAKSLITKLVEKGARTIFLSTCMTRGVDLLPPLAKKPKKEESNWINSLAELIPGCIRGTKGEPREADSHPSKVVCAIYEKKLPGPCPYETWHNVEEYVQKRYPQVNVIRGKI